MRRARRFLHGDRGSVTLEWVLWAPVILLVISFGLIGSRAVAAQQTVASAANVAARAATLEGDASSGQQAAIDATQIALGNASFACASTDVQVDASQLNLPLGQTGLVTVTVTCVADFSSIALPGLPGSATLTATASSPIDAYTERG